MYCCITIRLAVGVVATDTLLDLGPMLLTVSTYLQVRGVLIRGSLVQNGTVSEYKYHRPKLITADFEYQLFPCRFSRFSIISKTRVRVAMSLQYATWLQNLQSIPIQNHIGRQSPTLLEKMSHPFRYPLSHKKETDAYPESLESYLSLLLLIGRSLSQPRKRASAGFSSARELFYIPKHQRACLCPSLPHL